MVYSRMWVIVVFGICNESIFEMIDGSQQQQWVSHIELAVMVDDYWVQQWVSQTLKIDAGAMVKNYWVQKWVCHT